MPRCTTYKAWRYTPIEELFLFVVSVYRLQTLNRSGDQGKDRRPGDVVHSLDLAYDRPRHRLDEPEDGNQRNSGDQVPGKDKTEHCDGAQDETDVLNQLFGVERKPYIN